MDADSTFLHQRNFTKEHSTRSNCGAGATMIAAYMSQKWSIGGARFHMHEKVTRINELSPGTLKRRLCCNWPIC